ncbi:MAG TPA: metallophosphoesterase [Agriterribacter sp.]|nr:metallophosphoesterase [Agriterribacter sp.]HRQ49325.1 metallophosphoesterase [Agriterribacter sp.]
MKTCNKIVVVLLFCGLMFDAYSQPRPSNDQEFSFVFMTDLHVKHDPFVLAELSRLTDTINKMKVDFVLTGGDQVFDVMRGNVKKGDSLFSLYKEQIAKINVPVYSCMGNHELFGIYPESDIDSTHKDYKYGMFQRYLGNPYYSFDHKGWHFIVLNVLDAANKKYTGRVDEKQIEWLKQDLSKVNANTPVAIAAHLPFVSSFYQVYPPKSGGGAASAWIKNRDEVLQLFKNHQLKLVLQGHIHWLEDINVENKTHFITGGAVAGRPSWRGNNHGPRGFLLFSVKENTFSWKFIEYGTPGIPK